MLRNQKEVFNDEKRMSTKWLLTGIIVLVGIPYGIIVLPFSKDVGASIRTLMETTIDAIGKKAGQGKTF